MGSSSGTNCRGGQAGRARQDRRGAAQGERRRGVVGAGQPRVSAAGNHGPANALPGHRGVQCRGYAHRAADTELRRMDHLHHPPGGVLPVSGADRVLHPRNTWYRAVRGRRGDGRGRVERRRRVRRMAVELGTAVRGLQSAREAQVVRQDACCSDLRVRSAHLRQDAAAGHVHRDHSGPHDAGRRHHHHTDDRDHRLGRAHAEPGPPGQHFRGADRA